VPTVGTTAQGLMPTAGTSGQVLSKNSSIAYDTGWADPPSVVDAAPWIVMSGQWYDNRFVPQQVSTGATLTLTAGQTIYCPLFLSSPIAITALAVNVMTAVASTTMTAGVSALNASWTPDVLLGSCTLSAASVAPVTGSVSLTIPAGWSVLSLGTSATGVAITPVSSLFTRSPIQNTSPPNGSSGPTVFVASASAPASNPSGSWTQLTPMPFIWFRAA
jgi:hypothetical protein